MPTPRTSLIQRLRATRPAAVSPYFTLRVAPLDGQQLLQVAVPVRVEARATHRNRIRRQVTEALRHVAKQHPIPFHVAITVRRGDIPEGGLLQQALFELLRESGMMEQQ